MRRFPLAACSMMAVLTSTAAARADLALSFVVNPATPTTAQSGPLVVDAYVTSSTDTPLDFYGYQISLTPKAGDKGTLQFETDSMGNAKETYGQFISRSNPDYIFRGSSTADPNGSIGLVKSTSVANDTLVGNGDFASGTVTLTAGVRYLLTEFTLVAGSGLIAPAAGDSFTLAFNPLNSPGADTTTQFGTFDANSQSGIDYAAFTSTQGVIAFTAPPPSGAVPAPSAILLMGSGVVLTRLRLRLRGRRAA